MQPTLCTIQNSHKIYTAQSNVESSHVSVQRLPLMEEFGRDKFQ